MQEWIEPVVKTIAQGFCLGVGLALSFLFICLIISIFKGPRRLSKKQSAQGLDDFKRGLATVTPHPDDKENMGVQVNLIRPSTEEKRVPFHGPKPIFQGKKPE